jgi:hypothetical protein
MELAREIKTIKITLGFLIVGIFILLSFYTIKQVRAAITNSSRVIPYQGRLTVPLVTM